MNPPQDLFSGRKSASNRFVLVTIISHFCSAFLKTGKKKLIIDQIISKHNLRFHQMWRLAACLIWEQRNVGLGDDTGRQRDVTLDLETVHICRYKQWIRTKWLKLHTHVYTHVDIHVSTSSERKLLSLIPWCYPCPASQSRYSVRLVLNHVYCMTLILD